MAAGKQFNELRTSPDPQHRQTAAEIIGEVGIRQFYRELAELLEDEDFATRKAAVESASRLRNERLVPTLVESLKITNLRSASVSAIVAYGTESAADLIKHFREAPDSVVKTWM